MVCERAVTVQAGEGTELWNFQKEFVLLEVLTEHLLDVRLLLDSCERDKWCPCQTSFPMTEMRQSSYPLCSLEKEQGHTDWSGGRSSCGCGPLRELGQVRGQR